MHHEEVENVALGKLILGGAVAMLFSCLIVCIFLPFFLVLIVPVGIFLMAYMAWSLASGEMASRKAQALAKKHLNAGGKSELQVIEQVGDSSALVLNDWGVVFCSTGKRPVELSWNEISQVEEPQVKVLVVHGHNNRKFKLDLAVAKRFFLVTSSMFAKIPRVCDFDINSHTGESRLLSKLQASPRQWKGLWGHFVLSSEGIQLNDQKIHFDLLQSVEETVVDADPDPGIMGKIWTLHFKSVNDSFSISNAKLEDGYQVLKRVVAEKCPDRVSFVSNPQTPRDIAYEEFCLLQEIVSASQPLKKRKPEVMEGYYKYMYFLLKTFKFKFYPQVRRFLDEYAALLRHLKRDAEARELEEFVPD